MEKNHYKIHRDLLDIVRGYSELVFAEEVFYFKHFSVEQSLEHESLVEVDIEKSKKSGIKTKEEILESAKTTGAWSDASEEVLKSKKWILNKSLTALSKIQDDNQRKIFNKQIENQREDLRSLEAKRTKLLAYSAENLAESKKINRLIEAALFSDLDFENPVNEEYRLLLSPLLFSRYASLMERNNLLMISYHGGFFDMFATQYRSPIALFDRNFAELTVFQKNLLSISTSLFNKFKNTSIPDEIAGDPIKIMDYEEKEHKEKSVSHGVDDLRAKTKARGGKLKAEDFLS